MDMKISCGCHIGPLTSVQKPRFQESGRVGRDLQTICIPKMLVPALEACMDALLPCGASESRMSGCNAKKLLARGPGTGPCRLPTLRHVFRRAEIVHRLVDRVYCRAATRLLAAPGSTVATQVCVPTDEGFTAVASPRQEDSHGSSSGAGEQWSHDTPGRRPGLLSCANARCA